MSPNRKRSRSYGAPTPAPERPADPLAAFRARMRAGDYNALVGRNLRRALRNAAADPNLDAEIGALRVALVRLLQEEHDPSKLAAGVSRLAAVAIQASRLRQPADSGANHLMAHLTRVLAEIDAEQAAAQAASRLPVGDWYDPEAPFDDAESPSPCAQGEGLG